MSRRRGMVVVLVVDVAAVVAIGFALWWAGLIALAASSVVLFLLGRRDA